MTAKKPRSRYHHGALREAALEAAARDIDLHGHQGFTLERVAKPLGVTPAALYRHFANREELLREYLWTTFLRFEQGMDAAALAPGTPQEVLVRCGDFMLSFALENPGWHRLQFSKTGIAMSDRQASVEPKYFAAMLAALRTLTRPSEAELTTRYLSCFALMNGLSSLAIERVIGEYQSDDMWRTVGHEVFVSFVDSLASLGTVRASARGAKKKKKKVPAAR